MDDKFAKGIFFKAPPDNAPDFVVGRLSVKCDEFLKYAEDFQSEGWLNLDIKKGKSGKPYIELNTWKPKGGNKTPF